MSRGAGDQPRLPGRVGLARQIYVTASAGKQVPLSTVAHYEASNAPLAVNHQEQSPANALTFNLAPGVALGQTAILMDQATVKIGMPANVHGRQGTVQVFKDTVSRCRG